MILSKNELSRISPANIELPNISSFDFPEKVLQFGTGVLLRGLPDYFIDKANKKGEFNGRIVVVKSTSKGDTAAFDKQNGLYTICVRGIENGKDANENIISSAISRVLSANEDWNEILLLARQPALSLIISNTTEVGIVLQEESIFSAVAPNSYPAKLLAVLNSRFKALKDAPPLVVIATELIPDNGGKLKSIVYQLAVFNEMSNEFIAWLDDNVTFCNSLVDRIIPGKPDASIQESLSVELGYEDELLIVAEPYRLWAIEADASTAEIIGLEKADSGVVIRPDIEIFRELKIRLLNGTHTLSCGIACLLGIDTVATGMKDSALNTYVSSLMTAEIVPAIPYEVDLKEAMAFSKSVADRFANPFIQHHWISITFQYSMKMKIRVLPVLMQYYKLFNRVPSHIALGIAAYLVFMTVKRKDINKYIGFAGAREYEITDDQAGYFYNKLEEDFDQFPGNVLKDSAFWEADLTLLPGFIEQAEENYHYITKNGIAAALGRINIT
ncbi:MAG: tagaturonate reductase [Bacteroidota bacterium]